MTPSIPSSPRPGKPIAAWLARPRVAAPTVIACLALLSWSLFVRLPHRLFVVQARPATPETPAPTREQVDALAGQAAVAIAAVATNSDQLPRLIATLEQQARAAGFVVELTTRPPTSPVPGIPALARHAVVFKVTDARNRQEPMFQRLLDWLNATSTLPFKIEPGAVTLESPGDGLATATVELGLFSLLDDAKISPK